MYIVYYTNSLQKTYIRSFTHRDLAIRFADIMRNKGYKVKIYKSKGD